MDLFTYALAKGGQGSGGAGITVDSVLSDQSENPVQNKVLKNVLDTKADAADVPTDTAQLTNGAGFATPQELLEYAKKTDLNDYATSDALAAALSAKADASTVNAALALKANSADVTAQIAAAIGSVSSFEYYLCGNGEYDPQTGVPTVQNPDTEHVYLVPTSGSNLNMYAYINNSFTFLGTTEVDLSGYAKSADLAAVATSGSYNDLDDTPDIPTDTEDLTNGAGFLTNPQITKWQISTTGITVYEAPPEYFGNNTDTVYYAQTENVTEQDLEKLKSIAQAYTGKYINSVVPGEISAVDATDPDCVLIGVNISPTVSQAPTGYDRVSADVPVFAIWIGKDEESGSGYTMALNSTVEIEGTWKVFEIGSYLTEHQSLAAYATTAAVNAALADYASKSYVDSAVTGKQDTLTFDNSPTQNSSNPVKSGGIYTALAGKQDTLSFDTTPTSGSPRPVKSGGIYTALAAKANTADLADVATSGSYNDLSDTPTIPTVPDKLVTGSAKAYTVVVANSAPAAGTADSVITIVV